MGKGSPENIQRLELFVVAAVKLLVDDEGDVHVVTSVARSRQHVTMEIFAPHPLGQVLGRGGRNLESIRTLAKAYCAKIRGPEIVIELVETPDGNKKPPEGFFSIDTSDVLDRDEGNQPAYPTHKHSGRFA